MKTIFQTDEYHKLYDMLELGICMIAQDEDETILFVNKGILDLYNCPNQEAFFQLTGGRFAGMRLEATERLAEMAGNQTNFTMHLSYQTLKRHVREADTIITQTIQQGRPIYILQMVSRQSLIVDTISDQLSGFLAPKIFFQKASDLAKVRMSQGTFTAYCPVCFDIVNFYFFNRDNTIAEGDKTLHYVSETLREVFPDGLLCHANADTFYAILPRNGIFTKVDEVCARVNRYLGDARYALKAGIVIYDHNVTMAEVQHSFDMAKMACDVAKNSPHRSHVIFRQEIQDWIEKREYILKTFNQALEDGRIKVFYQPMIRPLSGKICGFKATVHWEDPVVGIIDPDVFWHVLEETRLAGRLDIFMIDRVVHLQYERKKNRLPVLPIQFDISRLGFDLMHPLEHLEKALKKYPLSRECVRIGFVAEMLNDSTGNSLREIYRFHEAGYSLCLNHFGMESFSNHDVYDIPLEYVEMDRYFCDHLDTKNRTILKGFVKIAKQLGIHTMANGVDGQEQLDVLQSIGLESVRGSYIGQPKIYANMMEELAQKGVCFENELEWRVYQAAGLVNMDTEESRCLFLADHGKVHMLAMNDAYWAQVKGTGIVDLKMANELVRKQAEVFPKRFERYINKAYDEDQEAAYFATKDRYMKMYTHRIAGVRHFWIGQSRFINVQFEQKRPENDKLDYFFHHITVLFEGIFYGNTQQDQIEVIASMDPRFPAEEVYANMDTTLVHFCQCYVHEDDQERFLRFLPIHDQNKMVNTMSESFRIRQLDGSYRWIVCQMVSGEKDWMLCTWPAVDEDRTNDKSDAKSQDQMLWSAFLRFSNLPFYWKDKELRYKGASQSFIHLVGEDAIFGQRVENLKSQAIETIDQQVMDQKEAIVTNQRYMLLNGQEKVYQVTEFPYYDDNNRVAGVAGWLYLDEATTTAFVDKWTGLMNAAGIFSVGLAFDDALHQKGKGYGAILITIQNYEDLCDTFDSSFGQDVQKRIAQTILTYDLPNGAVVARIRNGYFLFLGSNDIMSQLEKQTIDMIQRIQAQKQINGMACDIVLNRAMALGIEAKSFFDLMEMVVHRATYSHEAENLLSQEWWKMVAISAKTIDKIPYPVYLVDPYTKKLLFVNQKMKQIVNMPDHEDYLNHTCYELEGRKQPCTGCQLWNTSQTSERAYKKVWGDANKERFYVNHVKVLWQGQHAKMVIMEPTDTVLGEKQGKNEILKAERWANEAITIGLSEPEADIGIQKCITFVAQNLHAQRFFIFEERGHSELTCTYEWTEKGLLPLKADLRSLSRSHFDALYTEFETKKVTIVHDYEAFRKVHPDFSLPVMGVQNYVAGRLVVGNVPVGFTMVINLTEDSLNPAGYMLDTLTDFVAVMLRNRDSLQAAKEQGHRDPMTGVLNRRGFSRYVAQSPYVGPRIFLSCDINGLKNINDTQGHEAGDKLIKRATDILVDNADKNHVFRMGGDEFLVIREGADESGARQLVQDIKMAAHAHGFGISLGYVVHTGRIDDVDRLLRDADAAMYLDKGHSYRRRATDPKD